ncbi:MAG: NUDIX hydrolase [Parcubacteria group bacterium]|nr:NUDIX hydrolase [Parcubacteria group bacterium]
MITCRFEDNNEDLNFRHVTTNAIIEKNGKILLVKRSSKMYMPNLYCLPGGYLDQGETIEKGILREVKEETGYDSEVVTLFRINGNPKRDKGNVDFIFLVKVLEQTGKHDKEVSEVKWFDFNDLPEKDEVAFDHYENIESYLKYKDEKFSLPIFNNI